MVARAVLSAMALALAMVLPASGTAQADRSARADTDPGVRGVVVDRETRQPLEGVAVTLIPVGAEADTALGPSPVLTDNQGRFFLAELPDGAYEIELQRLGYRTLRDSIAFTVDFGLRIEVEMVPEAVELDPLMVVTEARSRSLDANGFYERRRRGIGRFLVRDDDLVRRTTQVSDVFRTMAGVRVTPGRFGRSGTVLLRGGCVPDVYLDGVRTISPFPMDAMLSPDHLEGVEVYQGSEVPPQFGTTSCGVVVIWTHVPNPGTTGRGWSWTRFLIAVGVFGTSILLTR